MALIAVTSSAMTHHGYDPATQQLTVVMHGGEQHVYPGVPPELYAGLASATSPGKFFNERIRGAHKGRKG